MSASSFKNQLYLLRKTIILLVTPFVLLPLVLAAPVDYFEEAACGYTILLMAVYWVSEVVPLAVTALLPLVMYPILGILPASVVSVQYLKDVNILFLGGLTVAVAVEHWNLHKRIALRVLTLVGAKPKWLLFGFMVTTAFLSMWISNVATTAMMIPIAQAVLTEMKGESNKEDNDSGCNTPDEDLENNSSRRSRRESERYSTTQDTPLGAEMGNIGEAMQLGKRLASYDEAELPKWAHNDSFKRYSKGHEYNSISTGRHSSDARTNLHLTEPEEDGPDTSTTILVVPKDIPSFNFAEKQKSDHFSGMCKALTISICYAANIGGTATLTGTGPNLIMAGQFKTTYKDAPEVDFGSWAVYAFPGMVVFLMFTWIWLQYLFLDMKVRDIFRCCQKEEKTPEEITAERVIHRQYKDLGPMSFAEISVLILFIVLAMLWLTRDPGFIPGWGTLPIFKSKYITDATVAMLITFILFIFPSRRPNMCGYRSRELREDEGPVPALLTWPVVQQKMAWNVILLLGGGFAMALGSKASGLSAWIGLQLEPLSGVPPFIALLICCLVICALTQCTSNTATATVFIPILAELAEVVKVNPLYFLLPATVTTSYAFMLPVSTPPNAIAYSYGHLKMRDMIKAGFLLNIIGIVVVFLSVHIMGGPSFDVFNPCPEWLKSEHCWTNVSATDPPLNSSRFLSTTSPYNS